MRGDVVIGTGLTFTVLAVLAVALRFYARTRPKTGLGWDDWTILLAVVIEIVNRGLTTTFMIYYSHRVPLTFEDVVEAAKYGYIAVPPHVLVSALARLSITILLVRLFGIHKWFKLSVISLFCIVTVVSIVFIAITFSQVRPVQALWDPTVIVRERWAPEIWIYYAAAQQTLYTLSDLILVLLPVMIIWNLQMPLHQKVGLVLIMALGLLTMVMSIMRTVFILSYNNSNSTTVGNYNETAILTLAFLEGDMVIILGCIPTLTGLIKHKISGRSSLHKLYTKWKSATRQGLKGSAGNQNPGISGAYLGLEQSTREQGFPNHNGNLRVFTHEFNSGNGSEDHLMDRAQVRKVEQSSVTDVSTVDV